MKKFYVLAMLFCLLILTVGQEIVAQNTVQGTVKGATKGGRTIEGTVTSGDGEPIPGATIAVDGTSLGTTTDLDGKYFLNVPTGYDIINVSFVGYETQKVTLASDASNVQDITLSEGINLDEVVVTAIGISREKKSLGYATQKVAVDEVLKSQEQNILTALSSKAAGVQVTSASGAPGGGAAVRIRGITSIDGNNEPLIVVDGIPIDNSTSSTESSLAGVASSNRGIDINSDDVADVNILKGPAAAALYGTRASNGAIIITTKSGKGGQRGLNINYKGSVSWDQVNQYPSLQDEYGQGFGGNYLAPSSGASTSWGPHISNLSYSSDAVGNDAENIVLSSNPMAARAVSPFDNMRNFFGTGFSNNHHISLSGASEKSNFYVSASHSDREGVTPLTDYQRTTLKVQGGTDLADNFKIFSSINYVKSGGDRAQQGSNLSGVMLGLLRTPISFDNSNGADDPADESAFLNADGTQRNYRGGGGYDNPFWTINQNPFVDDVDRVYGNAGFTYEPLDFLSITYRAGVDSWTDNRKQIYSVGARNFPSGRIIEDLYTFRSFNSDLLINLSKDFGDKISTSLLLGHNYNSRRRTNIFVTGDGISIPGFTNASGTIITASETGQTLERLRSMGYFGQLKLAYANMVFLDLTYRIDQYTTFGEANNTFGYPSVSLAVDLTEALNLSNNPILSFAKLRTSYARVGVEPRAYRTINIFTRTAYGGGYLGDVGFPFLGVPGFTQSNLLRNSSLTPEFRDAIEAGVDLRFLKGKINLDVAYYNQTTRDAIIEVPTAPSSGFTSAVTNAAVIKNEGIEVVLGATPVKSRGFRWDVDVNFSHNESVVEELAEGVPDIPLNGFTGLQSRVVEGQPYGVLVGGRWLRDESGNLIIENNSASPNYGYPIVDPVEGILGDPNPDFTIGLRNTFSYKGLTLSALFDFRQGGDMWNGTKGALTFFGRSELTENRDDVVVFNGVGGTITGADADGNATFTTNGANDVSVTLDQNWYLGNGGGFGAVAETFIEETSWIRLRDLSLSYSLPKKLLGKSPFTNVDITLTGRNLWLTTTYDGIDPDTNLTGVSNGFGLDYFNMPNTRGYTVGISLGF